MATPSPPPGIKKRIALLTFLNESPQGGQDLGITATEELRRELSRTGVFVVEPNSPQAFGSSKEIYSSGGSKLTHLTKKGKSTGTNLILYGVIKDAQVRERTDEIGIIREVQTYANLSVEVRIFNINSQKEVYSAVIKGHADNTSNHFFRENKMERKNYRRELLRYAVRVAVRKAVPKIVAASEKLDWVGRIARIINNKIYLNAGRKSGVQIGDVMQVITEGEQIYDPETGALIGISKGEIKGTIEIIDFFGPDGAVGVLHSGGAVLEGDFVQLY